MASFKLAIQNKLVEVLQTITVANGYHNDVKKVTKKLLTLANITEFPAITVMQELEAKAWADAEERLYLSKAGFAIIGFVQADTDSKDEGKLNDAADELNEDIQECILTNADVIFGATEAKSIELQAVKPELVENMNSGVTGIGLAIAYYHDADV